MNDLAKMKEQFEKSFQRATMENELEERFGIRFSVLENILDDGLRIIARGAGEYGLTTDYITPHDAARLLCSLPADRLQPLDATASEPNGHTMGLYQVRATRGYRDNFTLLEIRWWHNGDSYECGLKIDGDEMLEPFFYNSHRKLSSIERDVYKPLRRGHIVRDLDLPIKEFMCAHISFSGGHQSATEIEAIDEIINTIKNA